MSNPVTGEKKNVSPAKKRDLAGQMEASLLGKKELIKPRNKDGALVGWVLGGAAVLGLVAVGMLKRYSRQQDALRNQEQRIGELSREVKDLEARAVAFGALNNVPQFHDREVQTQESDSDVEVEVHFVQADEQPVNRALDEVLDVLEECIETCDDVSKNMEARMRSGFGAIMQRITKLESRVRTLQGDVPARLQDQRAAFNELLNAYEVASREHMTAMSRQGEERLLSIERNIAALHKTMGDYLYALQEHAQTPKNIHDAGLRNLVSDETARKVQVVGISPQQSDGHANFLTTLRGVPLCRTFVADAVRAPSESTTSSNTNRVANHQVRQVFGAATCTGESNSETP